MCASLPLQFLAASRISEFLLSLIFFFMIRRPPRSTRTATLIPYPTLFRSVHCPGMSVRVSAQVQKVFSVKFRYGLDQKRMKLGVFPRLHAGLPVDRKSTRLNSSH